MFLLGYRLIWPDWIFVFIVEKPVIPAKAGIHLAALEKLAWQLDPRLRGDDGQLV